MKRASARLKSTARSSVTELLVALVSADPCVATRCVASVSTVVFGGALVVVCGRLQRFGSRSARGRLLTHGDHFDPAVTFIVASALEWIEAASRLGDANDAIALWFRLRGNRVSRWVAWLNHARLRFGLSFSVDFDQPDFRGRSEAREITSAGPHRICDRLCRRSVFIMIIPDVCAADR